MRNLILGLCVVSCFVFAGRIESHYTLPCTVYSVTSEVVTVEDASGNLWGFYGSGYTKGENVKVTFYDNGTEKREDDEITNVKKIKGKFKKGLDKKVYKAYN